jgi:hypothetical protein
MKDARGFFREIARHPGRYYLIHYSSQSLYDEDVDGLSPRITSIVVMHFSTEQTVSFATHAIAESLHIPRCNLMQNYDQIEKELLNRFYEFVRDRREKYWVHWNMRNLTFGFEHLEYRYRTLCGGDPPHIPIEVRLNLSDILKDRYGHDYAEHPRLKNLMMLNGPIDKRFLEGSEEAKAFKSQEYIRMHSSTISKVEFFRYIIDRAARGKLRVLGKGLSYLVDRTLESPLSRAAAFTGTIIGVVASACQIFLWLHS